MSDGTWIPRQMPLRRILVVVGALVGLALVAGGGSLLPAQTATAPPPRATAVGRTTTICTVSDQSSGGSASPSPSPSPSAAGSIPSVSAVSFRPAEPAEGQLLGTDLTGRPEDLKVSEQGKGATLTSPKGAVVLSAQGAMATTSGGTVLGAATSGTDGGLVGAPCLVPGTTHWFSGLGATDSDRTELVLTNPDDAQAEVDLRFFGRRGRIVVPGSPGLVVPAHSSRTVALTSLVKSAGALGLSVQASEGRVTAVAKRVRSDKLEPAGADWEVPSTPPSRSVTIPGVPDGEGSRQLVVTNPGTDRATVQVQILGLQGTFAPSGAETLEIAPESSAAVELSTGLAGEAATVALTSDHPVTGAVISTTLRPGGQTDLAVQSAAAPLVRTGLSAVATTTAAESELVLSNTDTADVSVTFEVLSYDGVSLRKDTLLLAAGGTATRRLTSPAPSYVVVTAPTGATVVGGLVLTQPDGNVAGLATIPLSSPDVAGRAPRSVQDPTVGE